MDHPEYKRAGTIVAEENSASIQSESRGSFVPLRWRAITWFGIIGLALIATIPDPRAFYLIPLYPNGFDRAIGTSGSSGSGVVGYIVHFGLFLGMLLAYRRFIFIPSVVILVLVCALNTHGCSEIIEELQGIN